MFSNHIKLNLIRTFCILLLIYGCNKENSKLIIENKNIEVPNKALNITPAKEKVLKVKIK